MIGGSAGRRCGGPHNRTCNRDRATTDPRIRQRAGGRRPRSPAGAVSRPRARVDRARAAVDLPPATGDHPSAAGDHPRATVDRPPLPLPIASRGGVARAAVGPGPAQPPRLHGPGAPLGPPARGPQRHRLRAAVAVRPVRKLRSRGPCPVGERALRTLQDRPRRRRHVCRRHVCRRFEAPGRLSRSGEIRRRRRPGHPSSRGPWFRAIRRLLRPARSRPRCSPERRVNLHGCDSGRRHGARGESRVHPGGAGFRRPARAHSRARWGAARPGRLRRRPVWLVHRGGAGRPHVRAGSRRAANHPRGGAARRHPFGRVPNGCGASRCGPRVTSAAARPAFAPAAAPCFRRTTLPGAWQAGRASSVDRTAAGMGRQGPAGELP